jgi:hypothetical protein
MSLTLDLRAAARARQPPLPPAGPLTAAVIATWRGRMVNEHGSARVFEALSAQLAGIGEVDGAAACLRFADEEREHGALCGAVVEAAGGEALAPARPDDEFPLHADTRARAAALRNVLAVCCLAETVAVALIGAERHDMPDGPLRELLTRIWADEVGHARFGWVTLARLAPTLDADERAAVARYLPLALGHLEAHELAHLPLGPSWPDEAARFGLCDGADARTLFYDTVTDVIIPQLEAHGLPARDAWQHRRTA